MKHPFVLKKSALLSGALASLIGATASSPAADIVWNNPASGLFSLNTNWEPQLTPGVTDSALFLSDGTAQIVNGDALLINQLNMFAGTIQQTGGSLTTVDNNGVAPRISIGSNLGATATYTMSGESTLGGGLVRIGENGGSGVVSLSGTSSYTGNSGADTWIGDGLATGVLNVSDDAKWTVEGTSLVVGRGGGTGTLNMSGKAFVTNTNGGTMYIGDAAGATGTTATVNLQDDAVLDSNGSFNLGNGAGATATLTATGNAIVRVGGTVSIGRAGGTGTAVFGGHSRLERSVGGNNFYVGDQVGATGFLTVKDDASAYTNTSMRIGGTGTGTLTVQDRATVTSDGEMWIGNTATGNGTLNIEGGLVTVNNWLAIGRESGTGVLNMSGGTLVHAPNGSVNGQGGFNGNNFTTAGIGAGARGTIIHTGGLIQNANSVLVVGESGTVTWDASGGTAELGPVYIGFAGGSNGTMTLSGNASYTATEVNLSSNGAAAGGTARLNLKGGTLATGSIKEGAGDNGSVHFDGGVVKAAASNADFFAGFEFGKLVLDTAGMIFDTNGNDVTVTQGLTGEGGVTKRGEGLLDLAGASTYVGDTIVENGTLRAGTAFFGDFSTINISGDGVIDLAFLGTDIVHLLSFDGELQEVGTWGAIGSGADHESSHFIGTGTLTVTAVPEPSTFVLLLAGGAGFVTLMMRRKRSA